MKFSYNWIAEMVEGLDRAAQDLTRLMTVRTAECESRLGSAMADIGLAVLDDFICVYLRSFAANMKFSYNWIAEMAEGLKRPKTSCASSR